MEAKDIDLLNLPEGTMVKIVDKWRKEGGMQNPYGKMNEYLGCTYLIEVKSKLGYYGITGEAWSWYPEFFEAIKLPDTDIWYKVIEQDGKYVATDYENGEILSNSVEAPILPTEVMSYLLPEDVIGRVKELPAKYYVFIGGKSIPKILHDTYEKAEQEAKRLSEKEVGCLVSICKVEKQFISKIIVEEV